MNLEPKEGAVAMIVMAILGGAAHQAHQWLGGRKLTWRHFLFRAIVSVFVGFSCFFLLPTQSPWSFGACGLCSWIGADIIPALAQSVFKVVVTEVSKHKE